MAGPLAQTIQAAAESGTFVVIGAQLLVDLVDEFDGSHERMARWLLGLATEVDKPIGVNVLLHDGRSTTYLYGPQGWSPEKLAGFAGGVHQELEAAFGKTERVYTAAEVN